LLRKNRQKYAQKPLFWRTEAVKMGKFCLQSSNLTTDDEKSVFGIVNFLKRRFVHRVNFGELLQQRRLFSKQFFLDIQNELCYYIIYIFGRTLSKFARLVEFV